MVSEDNTSRGPAFIITMIFHGLIVLLLLVFSISPPYPLPEPIVAEVIGVQDLGNSLDGGGNFKEEQFQDVPEEAAAAPQTNETSSNESSRQIVTDESSDIPVTSPNKPVDKPKNTEAVTNPSTASNTPTRKPVRSYSDITRGSSGTSNDDGDGNTTGSGDQGVENGTPGGQGLGDRGTGFGWDLNGRSLVKKYQIQNAPREGIVMVKIIVDRRGKVISAEAGMSGSNTTDEVLFKMAEDAAMKFQFNVREDAPPEQAGRMRFIFDPK